jgi:hypothetical protein
MVVVDLSLNLRFICTTSAYFARAGAAGLRARLFSCLTLSDRSTTATTAYGTWGLTTAHKCSYNAGDWRSKLPRTGSVGLCAGEPCFVSQLRSTCEAWATNFGFVACLGVDRRSLKSWLLYVDAWWRTILAMVGYFLWRISATAPERGAGRGK